MCAIITTGDMSYLKKWLVENTPVKTIEELI
ncbi:hypothetical protein [Maribellus comscasis]